MRTVKHTVFAFTRTPAREAGRLTRQLLSCKKRISAIAGARLGAMTTASVIEIS